MGEGFDKRLIQISEIYLELFGHKENLFSKIFKMATPRIFVSSTCYDLAEIRDTLYSFIESLEYVPVFSDKNDVFYHPDLHTHDSCIKEIETCQLFILIIGGRYGGGFHLDTSRSIVNAEYEAAKQLKLPIYTFIKREVYEDHRVYIRNKKEKPLLYKDVFYPAIEKQEYSEKIFEFINDVRKNDTNNAIFPFEYGRELKSIILKQLAGLFHEFLWQRQRNMQLEKTEKLLTDLTAIGKKTEEILSLVYRKVDQENAPENIERIYLESAAKEFWINMFRIFNLHVSIENPDRIKEMAQVNPGENWLDFVKRTGKFNIGSQKRDEVTVIELLVHELTLESLPIRATEGELTKKEINLLERLNSYFEAFSKINETKREILIREIGE